MRIAICCTLRNALALETWLKYHLAAGFDRFYLFFEDPKELERSRSIKDDRIMRFRADRLEALRWRGCEQYEKLAPYLETEVMARQTLNTEIAIQEALDDGIDWLLHIDSDEIFYSPAESVREYFGGLTIEGAQLAVFPNCEAVPESVDYEDCFKEVTLFKINKRLKMCWNYTQEQIEAIRSVPQLRDRFFNYYTCGKSAARVSINLQPHGVHRFNILNTSNAVTVHTSKAEILHYPVCGFEQFWSKYTTLGQFSDNWFGDVAIRSIEPFHLEARDIVQSGRSAAMEFYQNRVMITDRKVIDRLIKIDALKRVYIQLELK